MAVIGIDLGTTNSACGVLGEEGVTLIPNRLGDVLTPSVVGLDSAGKLVVGRTAKERLINHSDRTVAAFKRLMGTDHKVALGRQMFSATELSALVLRSLKEDAEAHLGETVTEAVISVPAYFNDNQRHATKLAGELAGLKVERLINEPTAAAIAYGLHDKREGNFLILDMGGGTFDVSILEFFDGIMEVHASAGDNFLGGEDFVEAMIDSVLKEQGMGRDQLSPRQLQNLTMQMETAKRRISQHPEQRLQLEVGKQKIEWAATAEWFEKLATPLLLRSKRPIERAMRDADLPPQKIDEVVLVGGSTRMSLFRSMVGRMFGRLPSCHLDPDTVVAMGAAIQAGLKSRSAALEDIVLTDVCPYTLGTGVINEDSPEQGEYFMPIIERNTVVPVSVVRRVWTAHENQTEVRVDVYQGENRLVKKNVYLGETSVPVPKGPKGEEAVDIRYSYDMNGLLEVDVTVVSSGKTHNKLIEFSPGALNEEEKASALQKLSKLKFHPREDEENRALIARGERLYESSLGERRETIARLLGNFDRVLERQNPAEIKKARARLQEVFDELDGEDWI
ncbi:molecular chaperone HscC [Microbulbifer rhizosphaerae]|uniref:Molecular chaperone HscC n=1 Tax=Microbulbifer rhizosphaerae TaxID=1562603 RepID=A0A7W4ZB93_9GAMM|nr:molecular chaperone HscC [Microbulbifer rhizosphaerae]MBB3063386.1 molecular chaperone HscC [Microbulbifer rhizosphaerae]